MSRSFDGSAESSAAVDEIRAAFGDENYWRARLATADTVTTLDALVVRADGTVEVCYTQRLGPALLPGAIARFVPGGDLTMEYTETWTPDDGGAVRGRIAVAVSGGLGSCRATTSLEPTARGSQMRFAGSVKVKIPLVGGNLEKAIGADLARNVPSVLDFTTSWIAQHP